MNLERRKVFSSVAKSVDLPFNWATFCCCEVFLSLQVEANPKEHDFGGIFIAAFPWYTIGLVLDAIGHVLSFSWAGFVMQTGQPLFQLPIIYRCISVT